MPRAPPRTPAREIASGKTLARPRPTSTNPPRAVGTEVAVTAAAPPAAASTHEGLRGPGGDEQAEGADEHQVGGDAGHGRQQPAQQRAGQAAEAEAGVQTGQPW